MDTITNLQGSKTLGNAKKNGTSKSRLRFRLLVTMIVLLVMFASFVGVTFAWYVYQTGARTSDIRMAVGEILAEDWRAKSASRPSFELFLCQMSQHGFLCFVDG